MFYDNVQLDWTDNKICCRTIDNIKIITDKANDKIPFTNELEVRWGEHKKTQWLYACHGTYGLGITYKKLNVPEPDYRHSSNLKGLQITTSDSIITLLATFSFFRAAGADRIADALGLFTILTTQFDYSPKSVDCALSQLDGFTRCRYRIL